MTTQTTVAEMPADVFDALHAEYQAAERQPDEVSVSAWAEKYGMIRKAAYRELESYVAAGKMTRRKGRDEGKECVLYKLVE